MGTIKITPCILISFEDSLHRWIINSDDKYWSFV
jgi:hypothetical protein